MKTYAILKEGQNESAIVKHGWLYEYDHTETGAFYLIINGTRQSEVSTDFNFINVHP